MPAVVLSIITPHFLSSSSGYSSYFIIAVPMRECYSETLVSDMRHVSEVPVPCFGRPVLLCRGKMPLARGMAAYVRDGYGAFRQPKFQCGCCEILFF